MVQLKHLCRLSAVLKVLVAETDRLLCCFVTPLQAAVTESALTLADQSIITSAAIFKTPFEATVSCLCVGAGTHLVVMTCGIYLLIPLILPTALLPIVSDGKCCWVSVCDIVQAAQPKP